MKNNQTLQTIIFLIVSCIGISVITAQDPKILSLQFVYPMVATGQSIELKCIVQDVDTKQHVFFFYKQGVDPDTKQAKWYQLAEKDKAQYPNIPYAFWFNEKGVVDEYMMRVDSADVSMSGNYSCAIKSATGLVLANSTTELNVIVEPTSIKVYVDGVEVEPNSTRLYSFSSVHTLTCFADGSNPAAKIDMWHGNQDLTRRATNLTIGEPVYSPPASSQVPFLATYTRSTNLTIANWRVDVTYTTAAVTCLARASDRSPGRAVKFTPIVEDGPPHFVCNDSYIVSDDGNQDHGHEITCRVIAKPALTGATFGCEPKTMCNSFDAFPVHEWHPAMDTVYSGYLRNVDTISPTSKDIITGDMTLKIKMKKGDIIGRSYSFTAENARGQAFHKVTLVNSAEWLATSLTFCLLMSFTSMLVR